MCVVFFEDRHFLEGDPFVATKQTIRLNLMMAEMVRSVGSASSDIDVISSDVQF